MTTLAYFLRSPWTKPLGWALVQFLWQGAVVAALLAGVLWLLRHPPSSLRPVPTRWVDAQAKYLAACAALLVMAACPVITLVIMMGPRNPVPASALGPPPMASSPERAVLISARPIRFPLTLSRPDNGSRFIPRPALAVDRWDPEPAFPWLVAAWLSGILVLYLRLLGGWMVAQRLSRRETRPVPAWLQGRVEELARLLQIRWRVELLESRLVEVPAVIGCLRAVVLVPASALTGLSPQQLEALLAHELAHIRRYDFLVNLIQTAVETLLFYHPAVWWVSRRIRIERENCCDDLAVAALGDRLTYAQALAALEELRTVPAQLALAGSGGDLLARIRRILGLPAGRAEPAPAWLAGSVLLPLLLAAAVVLHASADRGSRRHGKGSHGSTPVISAGTGETQVDPPAPQRPKAVRRDAARLRASREDTSWIQTRLPRSSMPRAGVRLILPLPLDGAGTATTPPGRARTSPSRTGFRIGDRRDQSLPETQAAAANPIYPPRGDASAVDGRQPEVAHPQAGSAPVRAADAAPVESRPERSHPQGMDLTRVNLSGADLKGLDLTGVSLRGVQLPAVDLSGLDLTGKDLSHADLSSANLTGTRLSGADLTEANLSGANLTKADLSHCKSTGANLSGASLHGTRLAGVDLTRVDLSGADLRGLDLKEVRLAGAALSGADLAGWDLSRLDLSRVDLSGANLTGTRLVGAVLTDANLSGADLTDTDLSHARMRGANFSGARLRRTRLVGVDLAHVNLSGADLSGLKLTGVDLAGVPLPAVSLAGRNLTGGFP